jgi:hypothetical protein
VRSKINQENGEKLFNRNEEDHKTDMEKWFTSGGFIVVIIRLYIYGSKQIPN